MPSQLFSLLLAALLGAAAGQQTFQVTAVAPGRVSRVRCPAGAPLQLCLDGQPGVPPCPPGSGSLCSAARLQAGMVAPFGSPRASNLARALAEASHVLLTEARPVSDVTVEVGQEAALTARWNANHRAAAGR